ncbi:response regulator [Paenibacillus sp. 1P07SE]|uniref:response regulator n=1 Tax=Paenibacillus sp. 1P07SE TaxID=3132209 RepID=UPI0039A65E5E
MSPVIRAIVVDDEMHAINALKDLLMDYPDIELVGQFMNPSQALAGIGGLAFDIAFLDIEMPELNGLELGERLLEARPSTDIIYITAFDAYAVEAFEVHALDYLLKPVSPRRMKKTIERLRVRVASAEVPLEVLQENRMPVRIVCFDRFEIAPQGVQGAEVSYINWRTAKFRELLAYLIHCKGEIVRKTMIHEALWPELEAERAAVYLHTCIYQIRKTLKHYGMGDQMKIQFIQDGYRLTLHGIVSDADEFLQKAGGDSTPAADTDWNALEEAEDLYGSGYYALDDFHWAQGRQRKLEAKYIQVVNRLAVRDSAQARDASAIRRWRRLVELDPYNEHYHEELLRLYARQGERASVIKHFKQLNALMREELNIAPRPATVELYRHLLSAME